MSVTFAASGNSTPASGTVVATCVIGSENYQLVIPAGTDGNGLGVGIASPLFARLTDGADSAAVNAASRLTTEASIIGGSVALLAGANTIGVASVIQSGTWTFSASVTSAAASPVYTRISDGTDTAAVNAASRLLTEASVIGGSVALLAGANTIGVASVIQSGAWAVSASLVNSGSVVVTNQVSASISSGSVALLAGANTIGAASAIQSGAWAVSASLVNSGSVVVTNTVSASISSGSVALLAGANTIGAASAIQGAPNSNANGWPVKVTDGTNIYGVAGSPFSITRVVDQVYFGGSLLTASLVNLSASAAGCTLIVASSNGNAIVIVGVTFTTSGCQRIGWTACGNDGGASALVQTPMPFGTNGGVTERDDVLWAFPSGSKAVLTTTSACYVAGRVRYLYAAS
jgi:hypothetical protein